MSSARVRVKSVASTWVTPAYLRSAFPGGQLISSTVAKRSAAAKRSTSSSSRSWRMALTKPSCMVVASNADPGAGRVAAQDGFAELRLAVAVGGSGIQLIPFAARGDVLVDVPEEHLE